MSNDALKRKSAETADAYSQGNIANLDDGMTRRLIASTVLTESLGGELSVVNAQGYAGRYQAGAQWLVDAGYVDGNKLKVAMTGYRTEWAWADAGQRDNMDKFLADPSNWKNGLSLEKYLASAELQDNAFKVNSDAAYRRAIREGVLQETDPSEKVAGFLKARHISGYGGAKAAVMNGREIEDSNGTSNYDYYNDIAINRDGLNQYMGRRNTIQPMSSPGRTEVNPPNALADGLLRHGEKGGSIRVLQQNLHALGYAGRNGQPLVADGDFGANTEHAVRAFQQAHGLEVDGKVGAQTLTALAQASREPLVSETPHPYHDLYAIIGGKLPSGTAPETIANITLQARENGIADASQVRQVHVNGSDVAVMGQTPGVFVRVDLDAPTASLERMSEHLRDQAHLAEMQTQQQPTLQAEMAR